MIRVMGAKTSSIQQGAQGQASVEGAPDGATEGGPQPITAPSALRNRTLSTSSSSDGVGVGTHAFASFLRALPASIQVTGDRQRTRSLSSVTDGGGATSGAAGAAANGGHSSPHPPYPYPYPYPSYEYISESPETDSGSDEHLLTVDNVLAAHLTNLGLGRAAVYAAAPTPHSLSSHIWTLNGTKCPICAKFLLTDDLECHLVMCLTKPRLNYNEDVLSEDKGECVICLEELTTGNIIARLPCLCIYHKGCIDRWFEKNRCCPEHPGD